MLGVVVLFTSGVGLLDESWLTLGFELDGDWTIRIVIEICKLVWLVVLPVDGPVETGVFGVGLGLDRLIIGGLG